MVTVNESSSLNLIRVVIADEEPAFVKKLRKTLMLQPGIDIVGEARDAGTAAILSDRLAPHILLLDYPLCRELQVQPQRGNGESSAPPVRKIVMLTGPEKSYIIESFRLGAQGIVMKGSPGRTWRNSIATVAAGQYWVGNESLKLLIEAMCESPSSPTRPLPAKYYGLTPREVEIIHKIADGRSNKEVGQDFSIRERTVKHHLTNIFVKVGVSSRLELALFARDHKMIPHADSDVAGTSADRDARSQVDEQGNDAGMPDLTSRQCETGGVITSPATTLAADSRES